MHPSDPPQTPNPQSLSSKAPPRPTLLAGYGRACTYHVRAIRRKVSQKEGGRHHAKVAVAARYMPRNVW